MTSTIILIALFVAMWVVLIVPRQREMKRHAQLLRELRIGDEVMTTSGLYGVVSSLDEDDFVELTVAPGLNLRFARRAVAARAKPPAPAEEPPALGGPSGN